MKNTIRKDSSVVDVDYSAPAKTTGTNRLSSQTGVLALPNSTANLTCLIGPWRDRVLALYAHRLGVLNTSYFFVL